MCYTHMYVGSQNEQQVRNECEWEKIEKVGSTTDKVSRKYLTMLTSHKNATV